MEGFDITCDTKQKPARAILGAKSGFDFEVIDINVAQNQVHVKNSLNSTLIHHIDPKATNGGDGEILINLTHTPFFFSDKNKFTVIGCNIIGNIQLGKRDLFGCSNPACTMNDSVSAADDFCTGYGCCQIPIHRGLKIVDLIMFFVYDNETQVKQEYNITTDVLPVSYRCGSVFLTDQTYKFSLDGFDPKSCLSPQISNFPVVLEWVVSNNQSCEIAGRNITSYACKGEFSSCQDYTTEDVNGYRCNCYKGFQGNPYLKIGCQDINECDQNPNPCDSNEKCVNTQGGYHCKGKRFNLVLPIILSTIGFLILLLLVPSVYFFLKRRKLMKLREKFFRENGGLLLQQQKALRQSAVETTKIFTANELLKATDNYSESRIIGQGGNGTVYKVIVASQINHRNVVKLLGCLETEVPLLVFEFVSNGSLHYHIHDPKMAGSLSWDIRLRIATETAGALTYLHSAASVPIIHRDVKSANILLDDKFVAKVSDFGASRMVPLDETQITTLVQEMPISFTRQEPYRNLSSYFILSMQQGRLFEILEPGLANDENREEIGAVADLAMRCVALKGDERPLMKEVLIELIELRRLEKHPWNQANCEEALNLLNQQSESYPTQSSSSSIYSGGMPTDMALSLDCPR
ncbi:hypothetical protein COLO4_37958 [Corchorus olitorius]|uniref:Protein kinase domain-containing protein n=1 Tax=Corchorus olitorius TaxID=93759 RepID=A0A1R3FY39_9ROSI|nr:hypothetical protein COLO4_37958 [Corchorus olitorius]